MDQSFSPTNMRRVWDLQTRKGKDLTRTFPKVKEAVEALRALRNDYLLASATDRDTRASLESALSAARQHVEIVLEAALSATSQRIVADIQRDRFSWGLHQSSMVNGRQTYALDASPHVFFADKHLQRVVGSQHNHRQPSRQDVVGALVRAIDNRLPKAVVKVDVERFYESIEHRRLIQVLARTDITPVNRALIGLLLDEYQALVGAPVGLPTGIGLSAKLAEFFVSRLDTRFLSLPNIQYFARYVDDIVCVRGLENRDTSTDAELIAEISTGLAELGLGVNASKSAVFRLRNQVLPAFDLLGYRIAYGSTGVSVQLTPNRLQTIKDRVSNSFDVWQKRGPQNGGRQRLLLDRIRFLTGNTRLLNNKRNAMVGIYFSNPHLTDLKQLSHLDDHLKAITAQQIMPSGLKSKIDALSFREGFETRRIHRFRPRQLEQLRGAWHA
ncbi:antiviral reverse transcriptase Drt3a [Leifsonia sp. 1010]|uniref:antiviral reverse transcriptase Drt3a n=1 Tax=Leifsonia sp. 1010 TaxID=2817769 RepID=UPI00286C6217|nr:antiviral reverse transcriptase Drt3a [Leifsonia sp. 1010]